MNTIDEAEANNIVRIAQLGQLLTQAGLEFSTLDRDVMGGGHVLAFAEDVVVAVTAQLYNDAQFSITYGIARDLPQQRLEILQVCNRHNQGMTAYPIHLHDAEVGWDVVLTLTYPIQLFVDQPEFVCGWALNSGFEQIVRSVRASLTELGEQVIPYAWNSVDAARLQLRALI